MQCHYGHKVEHVTRAKYLGVTFNNKLKWDEHISTITSKANRTLGFLRRNLQVNNQQLKSQSYTTLVRPTVEYASTAQLTPMFSEKFGHILLPWLNFTQLH